MAQIKINFSGVSSANAILQKTLRRMERLEDEMRGLERNMDPNIQSRYQVRERLKDCRRETAAIRSKVKKLHNVVADGVRVYRITESRLLRRAPDNDITM